MARHIPCLSQRGGIAKGNLPRGKNESGCATVEAQTLSSRHVQLPSCSPAPGDARASSSPAARGTAGTEGITRC